MKVSSWNVNGLRAVIKKGTIQKFIEDFRPDILLLQETKLSSRDDIDDKIFLNYKFYNSYAKKKGYSGSGLLVRKTSDYEITYGMGIKEFDDEGRVINIFL